MRSTIVLTLSLMASAQNAHAQAVLERVLQQIDGATNLAQMSGVYANIAESVLLESTQTTTKEITIEAADPSVIIFQISGFGPSTPPIPNYLVTAGELGTTISAATTGFYDDVVVARDGTVTILNATDMFAGDNYIVRDVTSSAIQTISDTSGSVLPLTGNEVVFTDGIRAFLALNAVGGGAGWDPVLQKQQVSISFSTTIDGSITNIVTGVTAATAEAVAGAATATEFVMPTLDLGDMATTALGAVNTGDITLGVNSAVDEVATTTTRAISAVMTQIGGSADTGTLVLNVASNAGAINGSIQNTMAQVNGTIGDLSTTALGAVNTGTIVSGVNAAVAGIVGMSGQTASGL